MAKQNKYEDISSNSAPEDVRGKFSFFGSKIKVFFLRNRKRNLKVLLSFVICLVLIVAAMGGAYLRKVLSLINFNEGTEGNPDATFASEETEENLSFATMYDINSADSVKELLKSWATNGGEKLYSKNVINVLLIGEDSDDGSHRSDSMILASVNRTTKKITLCSFLRDSYSYMDINGSERYDKTNHAYCWAGPSKVMEVLSDNYKVKIDHYVSIDFNSFKKVIDLLGGVSVPITESEARYMNRTTHFNDFTAGDNVLLDGEHALIYSRIRKLDSEMDRTGRQRNVISSVVKNMKASSLSDLNKVIETFLPYVTTNYKTSEILSLGTQALSEGWLNYDIVSMMEPSDDYRYGVSGFRTYTGYLDVWIVDYVQAAREVQLALYERTNIEINAETHVSAIDMVRGSRSSYSYDDDDDDDYDYTETTEEYEEEPTTGRRGLFERWTTKPYSDDYDEENDESESSGFTLSNPFSKTQEYTSDYTEEEQEYSDSSYYEDEEY